MEINYSGETAWNRMAKYMNQILRTLGISNKKYIIPPWKRSSEIKREHSLQQTGEYPK